MDTIHASILFLGFIFILLILQGIVWVVLKLRENKTIIKYTLFVFYIELRYKIRLQLFDLKWFFKRVFNIY